MKVTLFYTQLTSNIGAPYILSVCIMYTASCTGIRNFIKPHTKPYFPAGLQSYTSLDTVPHSSHELESGTTQTNHPLPD